MKRTRDIQQCRELLADEDIDHVHIRKLAMAKGFVDDLHINLEQDHTVVTVDISQWEYDELMESLYWELRRALPRRNRVVRWFKRLEITLRAKWVHVTPSDIEKPDYSKVRTHLNEVASSTDGDLIILVTHNGEKPVDNFSWVPKLGELPKNATLVTQGFQHCDLDNTKQLNIGRLDEEDTVEYLTGEMDMNEKEALKTHAVHNGHPVAIEMALESGRPQKPLSEEDLEKLWFKVYENQISEEELHLLRNASHLIDLDYRDVALTVDKNASECRNILRSLENKGIVSQRDSKRFAADRYVKRHVRAQVRDPKLADHHRTSFKHYGDRWVNKHESLMRDTDHRLGGTRDDKHRTITTELNVADIDLFLAVHHLAEAEETTTIEEFISEIERLDGDNASIFMFGVYAQRFFFDDPVDVIKGLSDALLDIEDESDDFMSDTLDILVGTSIREYISVLSKGWSGGGGTAEFDTDLWGEPEKQLTTLQDQIDIDFYQSLPPEVQIALVRIIALPKLPSRVASNQLQLTGRTAERNGLKEGAFCAWADEVETLLDMLDPEIEVDDEDGDQDHIEVRYESLDAAVQDRIELEARLEEHRSEAQQNFQQRLDSLRDERDEIADQYIKCGEALAETPNPVFPYIWFAFGHKMFADIVLGGKHIDLKSKYTYYLAKREDHENGLSDEEVVVPMDRVESKLT